MAYPGEELNKEYLDYVVEVQSSGDKPLSKEEWIKQKEEKNKEGKKKEGNEKPGIETALSDY